MSTKRGEAHLAFLNAFATSVLTLCLIACSSALHTGSESGFLIPGPQAATAFAVSAGDTLFELAAAEVPRIVQDTARSVAQRAGERAECNRFFGAKRLYVLALSVACGQNFGKEFDSRLLVAIAPNGTVVGCIHWMVQKGVAELHPFLRLR